MARKTEIDPCSSRNVAADILNFQQCAMKKLSDFTTQDANGVTTWDPKKVYATKSEKIVSVSGVPVTKLDLGTLSTWTRLYNNYSTQMDTLTNLLDQMNQFEGGEEEESLPAFQVLQRTYQKTHDQLETINTAWQSFIQNANSRQGGYALFPQSTYPTVPDATSPTVLITTTQTQQAVSEAFYSAFRKFLDQNPHAHLQLMKYSLVTTPALFGKYTASQASRAQANKVFQNSRTCAMGGIDGLVLSMAASLAPPLLYPALQACRQFSAQVVMKSDGSSY